MSEQPLKEPSLTNDPAQLNDSGPSASLPASTWTIPLLFAFFYAFWPALGLPSFYYAPELRQIFWTKPDDVLTMGWYGRFFMAAVASAPLGLIIAWFARKLPAAINRSGPWIAVVGTSIAMTLTAIHEINKWMR